MKREDVHRAPETSARYNQYVPTTKSEDYVKPNPRIPTKLVDALRRIAEAERRSLNDQIVIAIEEHVRRKEGK